MTTKKFSIRVLCFLMTFALMIGICTPLVSADDHDHDDIKDVILNNVSDDTAEKLAEAEDTANELLAFYEFLNTNYDDIEGFTYDMALEEYMNMISDPEKAAEIAADTEKLIALYNFFSEYYDEIYMVAYQKAVADGTLALVNDYLDFAQASVDVADAWVIDNAEYIRSAEVAAQIVALSADVRVSIEAVRALVNNADALDAESYEYLFALIDTLEADATDLLALLIAASVDANEYAQIKIQEAIEAAQREIDAAIADAQNKINAIIAQAEAQLAILNEKLMNAVDEAKAAIEAEIARVKAELEAEIAKINAAVEAEIAKIQAAVEAEIAKINAAIEAEIAKINAMVEAIKTGIENSILETEAMINAILAEANESIKQFILETYNALNVAIADALTGEYVVSEDSYYVAIGGDTAYADILASYIGIDSEESVVTNTWDDISLIDLLKADLITIGYTENDVNAFAKKQILGFVADYLNFDLKPSVNAYVEKAFTEFFAQCKPAPSTETINEFMTSLNVMLNGAIESFSYEYLGGATKAEMDWAELVGEENLAYVEAIRAKMKEEIVKAGVPEVITYEVPVLDLFFANMDMFGEMSEYLSGFDAEEIRAMFGENATYTIEIPAADALVFVAESYLYGNTEFFKNYTELMDVIQTLNPDATVVLLSSYSAYEDFVFAWESYDEDNNLVSSVTLDFADLYNKLNIASDAQLFGCALVNDNVTYVDISDAETVLTAYMAVAPVSAAELAMLLFREASVTNLSANGHMYVCDQILNAITVTCSHVWSEATCETPKTCELCGEMTDEYAEHTWADATCTEPKTCEVCGETDGDELGHDWTDATCTDAKTCEVCGETEGEALGHDWADATCTDPKTCNTCGETEGEALGHTWTDATCTDPKTCSVCQATEGTALGHTWTDATCTDPKKCSVCQATEGAALGHTWVDATCTDPKTCSVCQATEGAALGHTWTDATCTAPKTCSVCQATEGEAIAHTYDNACDATCNVCNAERTPAEHVYGEWKVVTAATTTEKGKRESTCSVCGDVKSEEIPVIVDDNDETETETEAESETDAKVEDTAEGLPVGAIIAIVIGSIVLVAVIGFAIFWFGIKKKSFSDLFKKK